MKRFGPSMRSFALALPAACVAIAVVVSGSGGECVITSADPATYRQIDVPALAPPDLPKLTFYLYEASPEPILTDPLIPGAGFVKGEGSFLYEEVNGVPGLQRDGTEKLVGNCVPQDVGPLCLIWTFDTVSDETCGYEPDTRVTGLRQR